MDRRGPWDMRRWKEADIMAKIETKLFGFTRAGDPVNEYILSNPGGLSVSVLDYGAIIKNIIVPARRGPVDVVLGHDTIQEYELDTATYCGSFVHTGRDLPHQAVGHEDGHGPHHEVRLPHIENHRILPGGAVLGSAFEHGLSGGGVGAHRPHVHLGQPLSQPGHQSLAHAAAVAVHHHHQGSCVPHVVSSSLDLFLYMIAHFPSPANADGVRIDFPGHMV